jgi:guanylate kinase
MIVCVGASASGKTQLAKTLYQKYGYQKCVTTTTRERRDGEIDGIDYHFVSKQTFLKLKEENAFFEASQYHNHLYGIQKKDVHKNGIVIVEPDGANTLIKQLKNDIFVVYVKASEALRVERMTKRNDDPIIIEQRIKNDQIIFNESKLNRIDLTITNESKTLEELASFVNKSYQRYLKIQSNVK